MARRLQHRFADTYWTQDGNKVRVEMQNAPDINPGAILQPRKLAVVEKCSFVHAGTVIYGAGTAYLLALEDTIVYLNRFRAIEVTDYLLWTRKVTKIDPVTRMAVEDILQPVQTARVGVVIEPNGNVREQGIERRRVLIHTGADIQIGDFLGDFEVQSFTNTLGHKILTAF